MVSGCVHRVVAGGLPATSLTDCRVGGQLVKERGPQDDNQGTEAAPNLCSVNATMASDFYEGSRNRGRTEGPTQMYVREWAGDKKVVH